MIYFYVCQKKLNVMVFFKVQCNPGKQSKPMKYAYSDFCGKSCEK